MSITEREPEIDGEPRLVHDGRTPQQEFDSERAELMRLRGEGLTLGAALLSIGPDWGIYED